MKKVLIVTYFFPPMNEIAALRIFGFAKYLPNFGWEPIILTVKKRQFQEEKFPFGILKDIKKLEICETNYFNINGLVPKILFRRKESFSELELFFSGDRSVKSRAICFLGNVQRQIFNFPDGQIGWLKYGTKAGLNIIRNEKIDLIFSSSGPATAHLIAHNLQKQSGLPWVADFRDLWTQHVYFKRVFPLSFLERQLEIKTLERAKVLTTVSSGLAEKLRSLHAKKTHVITNGFDEDFYKFTASSSKLFTITYTGRLYTKKQDPFPLFKSLSSLFSKNRIDRDLIRVNFFGSKSLFLSDLIKKYHLEDVVKIHKKIPLEESIKKQKEATILLLLNWTDPRERGIYTGKLFEYLGAQRPILAIGPKGTDVEKLLERTKAGVVTWENKEINRYLLNWWKEWRKKGKVEFHGDQERIKKYTRRNQTRNLTLIFNQAVN